ncbi:obg family GTPase CgtA [Colletotrichum fioriniae PJ7]|uniref:Obg family GTPase CgtA n=1 Tax=Colletotrichum fioriniae PJ7 TaxID=1445577 RepID=A0A010QN85_9PEZI|nr:obg family GTPase CgtA [Colletotrichum fioriniae PJ7]
MLLITQLERHQTSNTTTTHLIEEKFDAQGTNQSTLQYRKEGASHHCTPCTKLGTAWFHLMQRPNVRFQNANERLSKIRPNSRYFNLPHLPQVWTALKAILASLHQIIIYDGYFQRDALCSDDRRCSSDAPPMYWVMGLGWLAHRILPYLMHLASRLEPAACAQNITEQSSFCQIMDSQRSCGKPSLTSELPFPLSVFPSSPANSRGAYEAVHAAGFHTYVSPSLFPDDLGTGPFDNTRSVVDPGLTTVAPAPATLYGMEAFKISSSSHLIESRALGDDHNGCDYNDDDDDWLHTVPNERRTWHQDVRTTTAPRLAARAVANRRHSSTQVAQESKSTRLNPAPDDYSQPIFADKASVTLYAGPGGHGCISFFRDAYLPDGPPNGGDGGHGGNIYIQAVHGETSLHKLARRRFIRAGKGKSGQGSSKGGQRGEDVIITVPVGTVVRELAREDPIAEDAIMQRAMKAQRKAEKRAKLARQAELAEQARRELEDGIEEEDEEMAAEREAKAKKQAEDEFDEPEDPDRSKFLLYPGLSKSDLKTISLPKAPTRQRLYHQPPGPIQLDLSRPSPQPILLAVGGIGGLGNPHFTSREFPRPIFATRGERAVTMEIELELKLLADVGLVGLPNAGKSTLLRAITNSRTRVGNWAFTTLQPNIGTVVLDSYKGRPVIKSYKRYPAADPAYGGSGSPGAEEEVLVEQRTRFTVADIPGLIEGAHLDRGLGIAFLRHVERAGVLAFVVDLSAGPAVKALEALWNEVGLYAQMREEEERAREIDARVDWDLNSGTTTSSEAALRGTHGTMMVADAPPAPRHESGLHIAAKPWYVVATKADLPETQQNFKDLKAYLDEIKQGTAPHPSGIENAWTDNVAAIPVSAINGQGVDRIVHWTVGLLDE